MKRSLMGLRVLLTGASSGIGRELARQLAAAGSDLLLTARRSDRLEHLCQELNTHGRTARYVAGDISDPALRERLLEAVRSTWSGLDLLINNAGVGAIGPFEQASEARLRRIMEVNFFAPVELIRGALPLLAQGRRPLIANVGSVLGHRAVPHKSEYCASKFALHGFSDALRTELARQGIDVLLISPSTTDSEFFDRVLEGAAPRRPKRWTTLSPQAVARRSLRAIRAGTHEIILSPPGKLLVWLDRLAPTLTDRLLARFG